MQETLTQDKVTHRELARLIEDATREVSATMLSMELETGQPYLSHNEYPPKDGVVALIGMAGNWIGTGMVTCGSELACQLSGHLLMGEYPAVNDEVLDAVAEITNMIVGNVKTQLEDKVGRLGLSIPTVVYGHNFTTRSIGRNEWTVVPFHYLGRTLEVQICLAPNRDGRPALRHDISPPETNRPGER